LSQDIEDGKTWMQKAKLHKLGAASQNALKSHVEIMEKLADTVRELYTARDPNPDPIAKAMIDGRDGIQAFHADLASTKRLLQEQSKKPA
jgi:hypothetical protein